MKTSESITKLSAALVKAHGKINHAVKNSKNPHLKNEYANITAVLDAVKGPLLEQDIYIVQGPEIIDGGHVMKTRLIHSSGEFIETYVPLIVDRNNMQGLGSAITYSRRFGLTSALAIADRDDDGEEAAKSPPEEKPQDGPKNHAPKSSVEGVLSAFGKLGVSRSDIEARYGKSADDLDAKEIAELKMIGGQIKNKKAQKSEFFPVEKGA